MKCILINQFANTPDLPGHTRMYEVAVGLVKLGWDVEVYSSDFNLSKRSYLKLKNKKIHVQETFDGVKWNWLWVLSYEKNNWRRYINQLSFCIHLSIKLFANCISDLLIYRKPIFIVCSSPQLPACLFAYIIAKVFRLKFILEIRDLWPQVLIDLGGKAINSFSVRTLRLIESYLYKVSDLVVVLAKGSENYVKERGAKLTVWLPNGPDLDVFKPTSLPEEDLGGFSFKAPMKILYAGAHGIANGLDNIISAAKILEDQPIQFIFVGDGPEKNGLLEKASHLNNIKFLEPIPKNEIPSLFSRADAILISLSKVPLFKYGISPNKLYDAYASARPVITTIDGEVNREVEENNLGISAPSGEPYELARNIKKLLNTSREDRISMGLRGRHIAEKFYSRTKTIKSYNEYLNRIIKAD